MEELQLSLTALRVDQKNFGLWLKSWQVGQVLQALVTDKRPTGDLVLRVGGQQITATVDIPIQKGAVLMMEVTNLKPVPTLKIVSTAEPAVTTFNPVNGHLQLLLPRQGSVIDPIATLLDPSRNANLLTLLGVTPEALKLLQKSLHALETLQQPTQLKQALSESGFFFESKLLQQALGGSGVLQADYKLAMLKLLARINAALAPISGGGSVEEEALLKFQTEVEGAIASISLKQLVAGDQQTNGPLVWWFELPFKLGETMHSLSLHIEREAQQNQQDAEQNSWKVLLSIDLPALGAIDAELFLRESNKIAIVLYSQKELTAKLMSAHLDQLNTALQNRGFDVSVLRAQQGSRAPDNQSVASNSCVNEQV